MKLTVVTGYNDNNEVIAVGTTGYEDRFELINEIANMEEVTFITTATKIKEANKGWQTVNPML